MKKLKLNEKKDVKVVKSLPTTELSKIFGGGYGSSKDSKDCTSEDASGPGTTDTYQ